MTFAPFIEVRLTRSHISEVIDLTLRVPRQVMTLYSSPQRIHEIVFSLDRTVLSEDALDRAEAFLAGLRNHLGVWFVRGCQMDRDVLTYELRAELSNTRPAPTPRAVEPTVADVLRGLTARAAELTDEDAAGRDVEELTTAEVMMQLQALYLHPFTTDISAQATGDVPDTYRVRVDARGNKFALTVEPGRTIEFTLSTILRALLDPDFPRAVEKTDKGGRVRIRQRRRLIADERRE